MKNVKSRNDDHSRNVSIRTSQDSDHELNVYGDIAYTGGIYDVSDIRLKENITPIKYRGGV